MVAEAVEVNDSDRPLLVFGMHALCGRREDHCRLTAAGSFHAQSNTDQNAAFRSLQNKTGIRPSRMLRTFFDIAWLGGHLIQSAAIGKLKQPLQRALVGERSQIQVHPSRCQGHGMCPVQAAIDHGNRHLVRIARRTDHFVIYALCKQAIEGVQLQLIAVHPMTHRCKAQQQDPPESQNQRPPQPALRACANHPTQ